MKKTRLFIVLAAVTIVISALIISAPANDGAVLRGDTNGDGKVGVYDLLLMRRYLANFDYDMGTSTVKINEDADMNRDGKIDLIDLCLLRRCLADENLENTLEITETDGVARVSTADGFKYSAAGYDSVDSIGIKMTESIDITFDEPFEASFNRFTVMYRSNKAIKIFVSYTSNGAVTEDYYFLEAGEGSFSGLVPTFLDGDLGSRVTGIRVENLEKGTADFALFGFSTEIATVPERNYYIKGSRYTLGIDLGWGGTLNYVSDNLCPIEGVTNMINNHDTGRLVQQSYYGTGAIEGEFEWGSFNGSDTWPYNPVQGGGQKNTASRLVDFVVDGDCVYIKVQPMDWGKSDIKYITPSYMENWFQVKDEYIRVKNRFVDFSGWEHPVRGQELPAFYTISYLDSFVWYDGVKPWTGDELTWRHTLPFWGDSQYAGQCSFRIKEPNTETWSAWISTEDNYGIGLYSPNIDRYSAGRHRYDGTKDASASPTNYVAPWKNMKIVSFKPIEYSYLITAGSVDEIRATFTENKDLFDNASFNEDSVNTRRPHYEGNMESIDFSIEGSEKFAAYPNETTVSFDKTEGALKLTVDGHDPYVSIDYLGSDHVLNTEDYKYIEFEYMIPETNGLPTYACQLFICAGTRMAAAESDSVRVNLIKDGEYHTVRIRLDEKEFWSGRLNLIRFDYFNGAVEGDEIFIRSMKLTRGLPADVSVEKLDFSEPDGMELVYKVNGSAMDHDSTLKATGFTVEGGDPYFTVDYAISDVELLAESFSKLRITYMIPNTNSLSSYTMHVFLCTGEVVNPTGSAVIISNNHAADGEYHTVEIDLSSVSFWSGKINKIRLDYFDKSAVGDVFYITAMELVKQ